MKIDYDTKQPPRHPDIPHLFYVCSVHTGEFHTPAPVVVMHNSVTSDFYFYKGRRELNEDELPQNLKEEMPRLKMLVSARLHQYKMEFKDALRVKRDLHADRAQRAAASSFTDVLPGDPSRSSKDLSIKDLIDNVYAQEVEKRVW